MSKTKQVNVLIDSVGRTIVGPMKETKTSIEVENPAVVNIEVRQDTGQIAVQLIPYIFREFVETSLRTETVTWNFPKDTVVTSPDLKIDPALQKQYENVFNGPGGQLTPNAPTSVSSPSPVAENKEPEVVKLFDE
jgi:hypothetical protein